MFRGVVGKAILSLIAMFGCGLADARLAAADELTMPYSCVVERGSVKLHDSAETQYRIIGARSEQSFVTCAPGAAGRCETMMVHKFSIDCGGVSVTWSKVADAGQSLGIRLPANLPHGFAPISIFSGRFVLPSLSGSAGHVVQVASQDLSPESVLTVADATGHRVDDSAYESNWTTTVEADVASLGGGGALSIAAWVAAMIVLMLGAGLAVAGRWGAPAFAWIDAAAVADDLSRRFAAMARRARDSFEDGFDGLVARFRAPDGPTDYALFNASLMLHAKLAEAELALTGLAPDLLLREVLESEIAQARQRAAEVERKSRSRNPEKAAVLMRALHRELDRIVRIAQGAAASPAGHDESFDNVPQSAAEAYRVLGLNAEAPPAVAKKLIDALRMTWHPDHARDEGDRQRREARTKQINAAWDMIRETRKAA